jgi:hypothetical protein
VVVETELACVEEMMAGGRVVKASWTAATLRVGAFSAGLAVPGAAVGLNVNGELADVVSTKKDVGGRVTAAELGSAPEEAMAGGGEAEEGLDVLSISVVEEAKAVGSEMAGIGRTLREGVASVVGVGRGNEVAGVKVGGRMMEAVVVEASGTVD